MKLKTFTLVVITSVLVIFSSVLDRELYYYGRSLLSYNSLPLNLIPEYNEDFEGGIILRDEHGFAAIGRGVRHRDSDFTIARFLKYGFNQEEIIAQVLDEDGTLRLILFSKAEENESFTMTTFKELNVMDTAELDGFKWIKVKSNDAEIRKLERSRFYALSVLIILLIFIVNGFINKRRKKDLDK